MLRFPLLRSATGLSPLFNRHHLLANSTSLFNTFEQKRTQIWCLEPPSSTWMCSSKDCLSTNVQNTRKCGKCGTKKPSLLINPGSWQCSGCNTTNPKNVKFCRDCASPFKWPKSWKCPCCQNSNPCAPEPKGGIASFVIGSSTGGGSLANVTSFTPPECNFCAWSARPKKILTPVAPSQQDVNDLYNSQSTGLELLNNNINNSNNDTGSHPEQQYLDNETSESTIHHQQQQQEVEEDEQPPEQDLGPPGFPWLCRNKTCGSENPGNVGSCKKCTFKIWPSDWMCSSCGSSNFKMRSQCFNCMAPIQPYWHCISCRKNTSIYEKKCRGCGILRPEPSGTGVNTGGPGNFNNSNSSSRKAGSSQGDWVCAVCHKFNYAKRTHCFSCETERGGTADGQPTVSEITPVGDSNWRCHICSALNFRSRGNCWQCQTTKMQHHFSAELQIEEHEGSAPAIKKEGFQEEKKNPEGKTLAEVEQQRKLEKRRKALEHASGWSGGGQFSSHHRNTPVGKGMFHPPGSASIGGGGEEDDENSDWLCAKCMRKNLAGSTECARCYSPKTVAPGSRALTALAANKVKKIHKL